jgi:hypothetical protein
MSAMSKIRNADTDIKAAQLKLLQFAEELDIDPTTNHSWLKAMMFLRDAIDGMPRCECGRVTDLACSDCRINGNGAVYVCERPECRASHETTTACNP